MKNRIPLALNLNMPEVPAMSICSYPNSASAVHTTSDFKIKRNTGNPHRIVFSFALVFLFSP